MKDRVGGWQRRDGGMKGEGKGKEGKGRTSLINGIKSALETNPGTSFDVVTSIL